MLKNSHLINIKIEKKSVFLEEIRVYSHKSWSLLVRFEVTV